MLFDNPIPLDMRLGMQPRSVTCQNGQYICKTHLPGNPKKCRNRATLHV